MLQGKHNMIFYCSGRVKIPEGMHLSNNHSIVHKCQLLVSLAKILLLKYSTTKIHRFINVFESSILS